MPTALIVEDEPLANKLLARLVSLKGYEPRSALDASSAIRAALEHRPDVVLLDLMLPDRPGFDVSREIRHQAATGTTPVVLVTARLASENRVRGFREGATDFVSKPYTPDQIFVSLATAEAWSRRVLAPSGPLALEIDAAADEAAGHLAITTAHAFLLGRLPGSSEDVAAAITELRAWFESARAWARSRGASPGARLIARDDGASPGLRLEARSGWSAGEGLAPGAEPPRPPASWREEAGGGEIPDAFVRPLSAPGQNG